MFRAIRIGMTTRELDRIGEMILGDFGATPAPKLCYGFPGSTMISINEEVAHAIPGERTICDGDMVNIDVSAELNEYFADTGYTMPVGEAAPVAFGLCSACKEALSEALRFVKSGERISTVELAIRNVAKRRSFSVIENLTGHGIGRHIHEEPSNVPYFRNRWARRVFKKGTVLTIEPFLSTGPRHVFDSGDGWTLVTRRGNLTAQFEHTVLVTDSEPEILTAA